MFNTFLSVASLLFVSMNLARLFTVLPVLVMALVTASFWIANFDETRLLSNSVLAASPPVSDASVVVPVALLKELDSEVLVPKVPVIYSTNSASKTVVTTLPAVEPLLPVVPHLVNDVIMNADANNTAKIFFILSLIMLLIKHLFISQSHNRV
jgi:hypothetical protein